MSYEGKFSRILDRLYKRRTDALRRILHPKPGRARRFNRAYRDRKIEELQAVASAALAESLAKKAFTKAVVDRHKWAAEGRGREEKYKLFRKWVREHVHRKGGKVYIFWRGNECRYVGRTCGRGTRPSEHFRRSWFTGTTRIDVYATQQKRTVPSVECLAIHRFQPSRNKIRASKQKGTAKCPLCRINKRIRREVRNIYSCRRG